jgi:hypothetical protein
MRNYRQLSNEEITALKDNGCWAEDWSAVLVDERFRPNFLHRVLFYGDIRLGAFEKSMEITKGFFKHSGVNNASLRNVTVCDNSLIENIGNYINNYKIGDDCYISNVCTMETTEGATFGQGNLISVLNEIGEGNLMLFNNLNSQFAAFMVKHADDKVLQEQLRRMIADEVRSNIPEKGIIGDRVRIINSKEITNVVVDADCQISGASKLSECTIVSTPEAGAYIGTGVIIENAIVCEGSSIINSVKMQNCFVGESCQISNGFTASQSAFFANSYMSNGEACAALCGPFTASHHKSSLLIGGQFSFYNAGSATNFSNHAYKMGPMHWGILERGTKTASGAYLLMPATIGTFSVCFGKLMHHPDTRSLPFSYLIAKGDTMYLVPGRNITTVGLYRDIRKWPKRDIRPKESQKSIVNFDWLSPFSVGEILTGKRILEKLRDSSGEDVSFYNFHEYVISSSNLKQGIKNYDIALRIYMGAVLKRVKKWNFFGEPQSKVGEGAWVDLLGLLLPESEEKRLADEIKSGALGSVQQVIDRFVDINANYRKYQWAWTYRLICDYYGLEKITEDDAERIRKDYVNARRAWIAEIRADAEKEYRMGDVEESVLTDFLDQLDHEIDYEK